MFCDNNCSTILGFIKTLYGLLKFVLPICLIVLLTIDFFKMMITKNEDDIKNGKKVVINRLISVILVFLVPTIVFLIFGTLLSNNIVDMEFIKTCWNLS